MGAGTAAGPGARTEAASGAPAGEGLGMGAPMSPSTAYQLVHDELMLDGNSRLNLATFVT
ncbi:glutamate decarboxylase, partial [Streptomyces sp. NPDC004457]